MQAIIQETIANIKQKAHEFGAKEGADYIFRENVIEASLQKGEAFFGFISPTEDVKGPYHDLCLVIFPNVDNNSWLISFAVGSLGYKDDFELALLPGTKRLFASITSDQGFVKPNFTDLETSLPKEIKTLISHLKGTLEAYSSVLLACEILEDPQSQESKTTIDGYIAAYASIRQWSVYKKHKEAILQCISASQKIVAIDSESDESEFGSLLEERKYAIITGAPGTGKTRLAKRLVSRLDAHSIFIQFHAETSYSDFVYGIVPSIDTTSIRYESKKGALVQAIELAIKEPARKVVLIADEINRANLASVLGPVFYLFEYQPTPMENDKSEEPIIEVCPGLKIQNLPSNFYFIGTMNTADRSLAIVDFALRRRFAWYYLMPKEIDDQNFYSDLFREMSQIFYMFAESSELPLQPGQGYYLASSDQIMLKRLKYEVFPLIKEYLREGYLTRAQNEFEMYFMRHIHQHLWE